MDIIEMLFCLAILLFALWITGMFDTEAKRIDKEYDKYGDSNDDEKGRQ